MPEPLHPPAAYLCVNTNLTTHVPQFSHAAQPSQGQPTQWLRLSQPVQVIQTHDPAQVAACLEQVERACRDGGLHAAGLVSYEAAAAFDPALSVVPDAAFPLLWFALFKAAEAAPPTPAVATGAYQVGPWTANTPRQDYDRAIATIREEIAAGNTYQTNYTVRLEADFSGDSFAYFAELAAAQPTAYAAYLDTGRWQVLSVSPELFFGVQQGEIVTRPMKGTTRRGYTEAQDAQQAAWLAASPKNRAENVMIVDLLRNDLGRVAQFGSVQVSELCAVERLPTLLTMTSTIRAQLRPNVGLADMFGALFPCGSVTGAPKISTMRLITALERQPRRVYCGAVGYVAPGGDCVFNVPIRTVLIDRTTRRATYGVGGGVTWDSDAAGEYDEVLTKAQVLNTRPPDFQLLETLRLEKGQHGNQAVHLDLHLERMSSSARYFGFPFDELSLRTQVADAASAAAPAHGKSWRLRLLLSAAGNVTVQVLALDDTPATLTAKLSPIAVDSADVFLYHKTTRRTVYEAAAAHVSPSQEVLLYNERGELTEFTTGNLVLDLGGQRYTPPQQSGLLTGVARRLALEQRAIQERVLRREDLPQAQAVWHLNSLRGWRRVSLSTQPITAEHQARS